MRERESFFFIFISVSEIAQREACLEECPAQSDGFRKSSSTTCLREIKEQKEYELKNEKKIICHKDFSWIRRLAHALTCLHDPKPRCLQLFFFSCTIGRQLSAEGVPGMSEYEEEEAR